MQLREFCSARSGDKGDIADISLFACSEAFFHLVRARVTIEQVAHLFLPLRVGAINRYSVPSLLALKFVIHDALGGGAAASLRADNLGKTMGGTLLRLAVDVPDSLAATAPRPRPTQPFR